MAELSAETVAAYENLIRPDSAATPKMGALSFFEPDQSFFQRIPRTSLEIPAAALPKLETTQFDATALLADLRESSLSNRDYRDIILTGLNLQAANIPRALRGRGQIDDDESALRISTELQACILASRTIEFYDAAGKRSAKADNKLKRNFVKFVKRLAGLTTESYRRKQEIVRSLNACKRMLKLEYVWEDGDPVSLAAGRVRSGDVGNWQPRRNNVPLTNLLRFPPLDLRSK